jgi:multidrug efflux pump subunit AcrA (membrane-fusion protein)
LTSERWRQLEREQVIPRQQAEEKDAAYAVAQANMSAARANVSSVQENVNAVQAQVNAQEANVQAQEANVRRLETLQSFQKVTAPFTGVITVRNVDVGALITAGSSTTSRELFRLAQIDTLRIYVNVPQTFMSTIQPGQNAQLIVRELPQKAFMGQVVRTASALDTASRTLPMEVQVSNPDQTLLPGMYAQVKLSAARTTPHTLPSIHYRVSQCGWPTYGRKRLPAQAPDVWCGGPGYLLSGPARCLCLGQPLHLL